MSDRQYTLMGVMSGSSLDGMDIAICNFTVSPTLRWEVLYTASLPISSLWKDRLSQSHSLHLTDFFDLDAEYGLFVGQLLKDFLQIHHFELEAIAIHGHTVYHNPQKHVSVQLGSAAHIAQIAQVPVICDFRNGDMALDGQGAPLAHMADQFLLPGYQAYINLGGIANMSVSNDSADWVSFDVCGANQILNRLAEQKGLMYDDGGLMASNGKIYEPLLKKMMLHPYLQEEAPKSLDNQYTVQEFYQPFNRSKLALEHKMATAVEWIALSIVQSLTKYIKTDKSARFLITGGGVYNTHLVKRINNLIKDQPWKLVIPSEQIVSFKEAILMGYLGALRIAGLPNCLASVTGAKHDSINGHIHLASPVRNLHG